ncbi:hypothetical protein [Budvicia aquatica]|uniref:Uncharacterized protein n=1 Tax=Budvicia aquatica TaxID=82979 RepID=A0A2C6DT69_9GAMM|nr:hypothetical protein [Budvicia aquatica]PHI32011.1 hypothetical protein CRN84_23150 [Budvicia aquatica]VFS53072.1 Uncharacterised protein [Budvicia aquatica]
MKKQSDKPDAKFHRDRVADNKVFDFVQKKVFLGADMREKLALLSQQLTGTKLMTNNELIADIMGYCVNHCYNELFSVDGLFQQEPSPDTPKISAAMSPKGQKRYRLYQQVKGRYDKLITGDSDKEKWDSVAKTLVEEGISKPKLKVFSEGPWSRKDIQWILTPENINKLIDKNNRTYLEERKKQKQAKKSRIML